MTTSDQPSRKRRCSESTLLVKRPRSCFVRTPTLSLPISHRHSCSIITNFVLRDPDNKMVPFPSLDDGISLYNLRLSVFTITPSQEELFIGYLFDYTFRSHSRFVEIALYFNKLTILPHDFPSEVTWFPLGSAASCYASQYKFLEEQLIKADQAVPRLSSLISSISIKSFAYYFESGTFSPDQKLFTIDIWKVHPFAKTYEQPSYLRVQVVTWLMETCRDFSIERSIFFTAVDYFDRVNYKYMIDGLAIDKTKIDLLAVTCLIVAVKLHDPSVVEDIFYQIVLPESVYSGEYKFMEGLVLNTLEWKLRTPTVFHLVDEFLSILKVLRVDLKNDVRIKILCLLDLIVVHEVYFRVHKFVLVFGVLHSVCPELMENFMVKSGFVNILSGNSATNNEFLMKSYTVAKRFSKFFSKILDYIPIGFGSAFCSEIQNWVGYDLVQEICFLTCPVEINV
ncbi:hypothetical protein RCL1_003400 [Eukaryota sp. TZLM3-RCL]